MTRAAMTTPIAEHERRRPDPQVLLRLWDSWEPERPELLIRIYPRKPAPKAAT